MTAPYSVSGSLNTGCAPPSVSSTGCSTRRIGFDVRIEEVTGEIAALALQGPMLLLGAARAGARRRRDARAFRDAAVTPCPAIRRRASSRCSCRGRASPAISAMSCGWTRPMPSGSGTRLMAAGSRPRHQARRLPGAQHRAPRGGLPAAEPRLRIERAHAAHRDLALAARAGPRLAGRFRQGAFHRPARAPRGEPRQAAPPARRPGHRRYQAGAQRAALRRSRRPARDRQCHLGRLVADLQAQHRARDGRRRRTSSWGARSGRRST